MGLTGSFGSGKSTVSHILKRLGASKVFDCDRLAHEVFRDGHPIGRKIKTLFKIRGPLDRRRIAEDVFSDPHKRRQLEALVHPYVFERLQSELEGIKKGIVIVEVPLLFETGFHRFCDVTVAVLAGKHNISKRLLAQGFKSGEVRARLQAQLSEREKKKRADLLIRNSGSRQLLIQSTKRTWRKLVSFLN